jgi:tetratricopeptide (TPR) repeat protein
MRFGFQQTVSIPLFYNILIGVSFFALLTGALQWGFPLFAAEQDTVESGLKSTRKGEYRQAILYFQQSLKTDPANGNAYYYLGDAFLKTNQLSQAQQAFQKAIDLSPDSQAARLSRKAILTLDLNQSGVNVSESPIPIRKWQLKGNPLGYKVDTLLTPSLQEDTAIAGATETVLSWRNDVVTGVATTGENYLNDMRFNGQLIRWSIHKMPLRLYIERQPQGIRHFEPGFVSQIPLALKPWGIALGNQLSAVVVDRPEDADISVYWVNTIDSRGFKTEGGTTYTAGLTIPRFSGDQLQHMVVKISTLDLTLKPKTSQEIYEVAVHELGHALGLLGHSENTADMMNAEAVVGGKLSSRDIATIRALYTQAPDMMNRRKPTVSQQDALANIQKKLEGISQEIAKQESLVQVRGSNLNWNNLGSAYYQKGLLLSKLPASTVVKGLRTEDDANPITWYQKALNAVSKALEKEPNDIHAYKNRAVVLQSLGDYPKALADLTRGIQINAREPRLYYEKTRVHIQLKQKSEALNALQSYMLLEPGSGASSDVQKLMRSIRSL